jgi:hypothetical protein
MGKARQSIGAGMVIALTIGQAWAASTIAALPMHIGASSTSALTVGQFVDCLRHGPIPMHVLDISNFSSGRTVIRVDNDLHEEELVFDREPALARLVRVTRTYRATLSRPDDLKRFVQRACEQAKIQAGQAARTVKTGQVRSRVTQPEKQR